MSAIPADGDRDLTWLITSFAQRIAGVASVLVLSTDGLVLARSSGLDRDIAETLAAVTSGLASLTAGAARHLGAGTVHQVIVEMAGGYLFVTSVSQGATLAVYAERRCDIGLVGYEMTMLASRVGHALTPAPRTTAAG